jgi:uncharacterized protein (DUF2384 family)
MSRPESLPGHETKPVDHRRLSLRKSRKNQNQPAEKSRRQADVVQAAWRHFGEPGPVIAFLNTRHAGLEGQPLQLAIESDEGLERVETLLRQMTLNA